MLGNGVTMPPVKIALFANHDSMQLGRIAQAILDAGGDPVVCDIQAGGANQPVVVMGQGEARWGDCDFSAIGAVHIRCTSWNTPPALPPVLDMVSHEEWRVKFLREQQFAATTMGFFSYLSALGKLVVNPLTRGYIDHDAKGQFYEKMHAHGFCVPQSLTTNNPDSALAFVDRVGCAVVKPAVGVGSTRLVDLEDRQRMDALLQAPALFQERVPGEPWRIHIVGNKVVLALRILSQGAVDSRTGSPKFVPVQLDPDEGAKLVAANRFLGLHYAAWDVIADAQGRLCYLDCNPGPYVMWIGDALAAALFKRLAIFLVQFARSGGIDEADHAVTPCLEKEWC